MPKKAKYDPAEHHPLRGLRIEQRYTLQDLGEKIGVSQTAIRYWELNSTPLPQARAQQLAKVLNCQVDELRPFHAGRQGATS